MIKSLLLALGMMDYMLICVAVCAVLGAITGIVAYKAGKKGRVKKDNQQTSEQQDTLTQEQEYLEVNDTNEIVMSRNVIYSVGMDGQLKEGQYELKNADSTNTKFNVRLNGLVREYVNGDIVVLTDGDTISPVSGSVLLAKFED